MLKDQLTVTVGSDTFNFKVPTVHDEIKVGIRARTLRQTIEGPGSTGDDTGLDGTTLFLGRACATLEVLLKTSSARWVWSDAEGGPVVDSAKFPPERVNEVMDIYIGFQAELASFREGGNPAQPALDKKTVAGESDTGGA